MAKTGLETKASLGLEFLLDRRREREQSSAQSNYRNALKKINKILDLAIKEATKNPEAGIAITRRCTWWVMEAIPELASNQIRANTLRQFATMESCLALVRQPELYLADVQKQFAPKFDARQFEGGDIFNTAIKSQRQRLYAEGQGFNTHEEKEFCRKRSELLAAVEKAYNRLRDQALGRPAENSQGMGR